MGLNHFDKNGRAVMVDISAKQPTLRIAVAQSRVRLQPEMLASLLEGGIAKGDVLAVARLAAIAAAKKTPDLIPLSHPLAIHAVAVEFDTEPASGIILINCTVKAFERTGVEMEAMVSASVAALTIYDMCKGLDKGITIGETVLLYKEGGKGGVYQREMKP